MLNYLREKLKKTRKEKQQLENRNIRLSSEVSLSTVKVAEVEADRAQINLEYRRLKVFSEEQAKKIKNLEQDNFELSAGKAFG